MTKFKGFSIYIPSIDTRKESVHIRLSLPKLVPLFLLLIPIVVLTISSFSAIWSAGLVEYRYGLEQVKRQVHLARIKKITKESESYKTAIQTIIDADKLCRISYGMIPLDSGRVQAGIGGTEPASSQALAKQEHRDIITALRLQEQFDFYSRQTRLITASLARVEKRMESEQIRLRATPSIFPASGAVGSEFGYRFHPVLGRTAMHEGVDINNREWTPIIAAAEGVVVFAGWDNGGYGNMVDIRHTASGYTTRYAHLVDIDVQRGDAVERGEQIGSMGSTGRSTGSHLHYEVLVGGRPIDPAQFFVGRYVAPKHDSY